MGTKLKGWLIVGWLGAMTSSAFAEDITLTTYYPSPRGVYDELRTTNNTYLAMLAGNVGIGVPSLVPPLTSRLVVRGASSTAADSALDVQNQAGASLLFVRDDGNVGIGTTTPVGRLDVVGSLIVSENTGQPTFNDMAFLGRAGGNIELFGPNGTDGVGLANNQRIVLDANNDIQFRTDSTPGPQVVRMLIDTATGNVEIGTGTPTQALEIAGDDRVVGFDGFAGPWLGLLVHNPAGDGSAGFGLSNQTTQSGFAGNVRGNRVGLFTTNLPDRANLISSSELRIFTGWNPFPGPATLAMVITPDGNVGIGNPAPTPAPQILLDLNAAQGQDPVVKITSSNACETAIELHNTNTGVSWEIEQNRPGCGSGFAIHGEGADPQANLSISEAGNVGVGTLTPTAAVSPANNKKGNLDANDVWLRSTGQWVSQGSGGWAFGGMFQTGDLGCESANPITRRCNCPPGFKDETLNTTCEAGGCGVEWDDNHFCWKPN